ncbi:hypothetical protein OA92_07145 [Marinomonas sp. SBI22]|jgi:hypothetical protein|uniref:hypothetical protein n=1 Tax=unclassified Marinomonas TaxID=196814 RepID=UPI0007AF5699|nr:MULTISPECIES: hypothetical protein [unclassified Marinomonas]KZM44422.1 hypothetical protein OA92_07145 [Marinomonas sp. SBI22]KZM45580.1 hypothetical protein OA91_08290 [Marinomonas sp. SBI8L]
MKAIKLASIFAVSAVAAAVSTTTIAAEPVFSGTAGVSFTSGASKDDVSGTDDAEIEIAIDTGVVYMEVEFSVTDTETVTTGLEKAYVTQGAVQFGRFDGTLADAGFLGIAENSAIDLVSNSDTDDTGIRYSISDELTVSIEATQANGVADASSEVGMALSYVADMGPGTFGISGGSVGESNAVNAGYSMDLGGATVAVAYAVGEQVDTDSSSTTYQQVLDKTSAALSVEMTPSDATTLNIEYTSNTSETIANVETDKDGFYVYGDYTAGDLTYYVEYYSKDFGDTTEIGVNASF